jgi:putative flippase GtrA
MNAARKGWLSPQLIEFIKYVGASAVALLVDYGVYWFVARQDWLTLPQAAVTGYLAGLVVAYFLVSARIFKDGWLKHQKIYEMLLFLSSGLLGTVITYGTVKLYVLVVGEHLNQAKLAAIGISFFSVYVYRKYLVFKRVTEPSNL